MIKAKPIKVGDYVYRSRTEARWGLMFERLGIEFVYEPKCFSTKFGYYLPDFYLTKENLWIEVKPNLMSGPKCAEVDKLGDVVSQTSKNGIVLCGFPKLSEYRSDDGKTSGKEPDNCNGFILKPNGQVSGRYSINWLYQLMSSQKKLDLIEIINDCYLIGRACGGFDLAITRMAERGVINRYSYHDRINNSKYQGHY